MGKVLNSLHVFREVVAEVYSIVTAQMDSDGFENAIVDLKRGFKVGQIYSNSKFGYIIYFNWSFLGLILVTSHMPIEDSFV